MKFEYKSFFPYPNVRPEQDISIAFALDAILNQKKKFIVLELGTGCGKSAVGLTIARYLRNLRDEKEDEEFTPGSYILTTQKILQEQYMDDFGPPAGALVSIKSATNFQCEYYPENTCAESRRLIKNERKGTPFWKNCALNCCYSKEKKKFLESFEGITNYSYFLAETMYAGAIKPRDLLVLDESHNCEGELSKFIEIVVSEKFAVDVLKLQWPKTDKQNEVIRWISNTYEPALVKYIEHINETIAKFDLAEKMKNNEDFNTLSRQHEILDKHVCKVHRFLEMYTWENWVMNLLPPGDKTLRKFEFKPVDVGPYSEELLFKFGKNVLLMSATIVNRDVYCETLGIPRDQVAFLSLDSPFPIENRPILYISAGSMTQAEIDKSLPKVAEIVKALLANHKNEKGIIHTHTYKIANYIKKNVKNKRLIFHDSDNREAMVEKHLKSKNATVLVSPSLSEGIDLKDDLSRWQVLCKVPYPYLGDKLVKKRMNKRQSWYPYQTAKTIVQAVGRSIRNENDHAVTYILDGSWDMFYSRNSRMLPESFKKALQT